ncbi:hypothetical protein WDU94_002112, partial [Cyamophila willieti]
MLPGDCLSVHCSAMTGGKHHKAANTCGDHCESDECCQSATRCHENSRHYTKKTDVNSRHLNQHEKEEWSDVSVQRRSDCLMSRITSYLPWWSKDPRQRKSRTPEKCFSRCILANVRDQRKPSSSICYSDGEEILQAKKQMIEAEERARKLEKQKIKHRKETYKRYKMKAKEIEKQVKIMEKEKIKQKQKALHEAHRMEQEKLIRERQLLREKAKLDRMELRNREKNGKHHMKSLKRKLRAKCEYIYYDSDGPSDEMSESSLERIPQYRKPNERTRSKRNDKMTHSFSRSKDHPRQNNCECGEHMCTDEEVARILNALLDTNIQFEPKIIAKIKTLLQKNTKIQGYFDEYRRNNLTHQLKYKLFSRIGPDSKLKFFLNSKKKWNLSNDESRELVRCILDQINKTEGQLSGGDTALEKICNVLWKPPGNLSSTTLSEQQNEQLAEDKQSTVTNDLASSRKMRKKTKSRDRTKSQNSENFRKFARKEKDETHKNSLRAVNSLDLAKKKLSDHSKRKKKRGSKNYRQSRLRQKAKRYIGRLTEGSASRTRSPQDKSFPPDKTYKIQTDSNESDLELEQSDKENSSSTLPSVPNLPRFTLWRIFKKTQSKDRVSTDKSCKGDKFELYDKKCEMCDKSIETDNVLELVGNSEEEYDEEEPNEEPIQYHNDPDTNGDMTSARRTGKFWTLFNQNRYITQRSG